jgi:hypothetical protein
VGKNVTIIVRISSIVSNVNIVHDPSAYDQLPCVNAT